MATGDRMRASPKSAILAVPLLSMNCRACAIKEHTVTAAVGRPKYTRVGAWVSHDSFGKQQQDQLGMPAQTSRQADKQTSRQADKQTSRQADKQTSRLALCRQGRA